MVRLIVALSTLVMAVLGCRMLASNSTAVNNSNQNSAANPTEISFANSNSDAVAISSPQGTPTPPAANAVCPNPAKPCHHKEKQFDDWELSFKMPGKLKPNKTYFSAPFYALILKTYKLDDDCDGGEYIEAVEKERKELQRNEPGRKVFASYECPNMGAVSYDFPSAYDAKRERSLVDNFLAIYAGETKEDAEELMGHLKAKYPNAQLKQMKATFEIIDQ
jgi:hypothetical protein